MAVDWQEFAQGSALLNQAFENEIYFFPPAGRRIRTNLDDATICFEHFSIFQELLLSLAVQLYDNRFDAFGSRNVPGRYVLDKCLQLVEPFVDDRIQNIAFVAKKPVNIRMGHVQRAGDIDNRQLVVSVFAQQRFRRGDNELASGFQVSARHMNYLFHDGTFDKAIVNSLHFLKLVRV